MLSSAKSEYLGTPQAGRMAAGLLLPFLPAQVLLEHRGSGPLWPPNGDRRVLPPGGRKPRLPTWGPLLQAPSPQRAADLAAVTTEQLENRAAGYQSSQLENSPLSCPYGEGAMQVCFPSSFSCLLPVSVPQAAGGFA